ncbi:type II toxin-antitoxin system PemK/MazF family toxin [Staphylococcus aureus]|uniref:type II toxin-antitoxin system PemK/MazF family toxin n=1 Tax=Staphylococcus aureus TaxID=1280 RepID=UPI00044B7282|nr:type II toxin-antitoxin system PemK/MazF family toxin [Staphylococcus aureus]EXM42874.1 hypothetical protein W320_02586 [Staphylococcus aureus DAR5855]PZL23641.1 hypothetical protein C7Q33_05590 [Staphylococcus aureus]RJE34487.1 hypothetical protein CFZ97_03915 [Staphylococcus aureus]CAC8000967.1 pemK-like family protein [Staphylococcus aureus]CAC8005699.1 pemK-like family protein [Staphylococcus aureus]
MEENAPLETAVNNFKKIQNSEIYKFKYMNSWCLEYSEFLLDEVRLLKENKSYTRYKKGTIIYVKLGVNVGREFSGNHFCMVLNNHDSNKNPILTVVPLTSSRSKFNVHIEEDLLPLVLEKMDVTGKDLAKKIMNNLEKVSKAENPYDQKLLDENKSLNDDFKKYSKVRKRYGRFKYKKTYANVLNITTISKDRISKINRYDPAGEISYSKETVDKIENSIKIRFLS